MQDSRGPRVLVVEDDYLVRILVQGLVEELGYAFVGGVGDGREAVQAAKLLRPDVIIMDISMREMDGIEATKLVQVECPTPVVALTAFESAEMVQKASDAGMGAYLVKPPSAPELDRAIAIAIARFADMQELRRLRSEIAALTNEQRRLEAKLATLGGLVCACPRCLRVRLAGGGWKAPEEVLQADVPLGGMPGLCPDCQRIA
jgi:AmiR/NasT family two-component response regulator